MDNEAVEKLKQELLTQLKKCKERYKDKKKQDFFNNLTAMLELAMDDSVDDVNREMRMRAIEKIVGVKLRIGWMKTMFEATKLIVVLLKSL